MYKKILLLTLIALAIASQNKNDQNYFLSPPIPPTAFLGQFYTTQFRVIGLDNPVFSFIDLPPYLKGSRDGTIQGSPEVIGSFAIKVCFKSKGVDQTRDVVVRVAPSIASTSKINSEAGVLGVDQFIVLNPNTQFTYGVGQKIKVNLAAQHGKNPYTWTYINLPSQLVGHKDGVIEGLFDDIGYYSFSASCSDSNGQNADSYFTFNIQPKTFVRNALIEVPNRNVPIRYDIKQVEGQQLNATNAVYAAIKLVEASQKQAAKARQASGKAALALQFATAQENAANKKAAQALADKNAADIAENKAHQILENTFKRVELATLNLKNKNENTRVAERNLHDAKVLLQKASANLKTANNLFINAQSQTAQSIQNLKSALTANLNARNVYNITFEVYSNAKKQVQQARNKKDQTDNLVANAKHVVGIANQVNDNAQSDLTVAQSFYEKTYSALNNANSLVSRLRQNLNDAGDLLGVAKFNLQQANNNLFVAQSGKEQADKATAIVRTQSSILPAVDSQSTYIFGGCVQNAYPTIAGSARIDRSNKLGYSLSSGNTLLFGDCTTRDLTCRDGDIINYEGYIKDGYVHAVYYKKH